MNKNSPFKVAFISDLHVDFYIPPTSTDKRLERKMNTFIDKHLKLPEADVLVFAGDNSHYPSQIKHLLQTIVATKMYKKIFVTFGNHDMYLVSSNQRNAYKRSWKKVEHLKSICDSIDTVEFLSGNIVDVDGVKIGGSCMWYDFSYGRTKYGLGPDIMRQLWVEHSNDGHLIVGDEGNTIRDKSEIHFYNSGARKRYSISFNPMKFFQLEKEKLDKIVDECDVFISHVSPAVPPDLNPEFCDAGAGFYFFDGSEYLSRSTAPKLWIFGHTHDRYNFTVNNTRLVCNPLGYQDERLKHSVSVIDLNDLDNFSFK